MPAETCEALIHVRDFTKGHPDIEANNHPIRHGAVVGVHNGIVSNDDELLARYGIERAEPQMTVDSEAIFALVELREHDPRALSELRGAMAAAWLDDRDDRRSTSRADACGRCGWRQRTGPLLRVDPAGPRRSSRRHCVPGSTYARCARAACSTCAPAVSSESAASSPTAGTAKTAYLPPVRAPREAVSCLERLAALASVSAA